MFNFFEKSTKIRSYKVFEKKLIFVNESFHIYINDTKISDDAIDNGYTYFSNNIIYLSKMNTFIGYDKFENLSYVPYSEDKISNSIIFSGDFKLDYPNFTNSYYLYDLVSKEKKFLLEYNNLFSFLRKEDFVFLTDKTKIQSFAIPQATPKWQYNLEELGTYITITNETLPYEVQHFMGVDNNQLFIQMQGSGLLILDVEKGKQQAFIKFNEEINIPAKIHFEDSANMHLIEGKIIWLTNQMLIHYDIETQKTTLVKEYFSAPRGEQYRFFKNTYHKGKIYFVADQGWQYVTPSRIGVMDAQTGEVLWQEQLPKTGGINEAPQVTDDKLYIRTNNSELYIFQKEEIVYL